MLYALEPHFCSVSTLYCPVLFTLYCPVLFTVYRPVLSTVYCPVLFTVYCPVLFTVYCPVLFTVYFPVLFTVYRPVLFTVYCPVLFTVYCPVLSTVYCPVLFTVYCPVLFTVYCPVLFTVYCPVLFTVYCPVLFTLYCSLNVELFLMTDQDGYDATEESHEKTNLYIFHNSSLRIHDNPSLLKSIVPGKLWRAVFILDVYQLSRVVGSSRNRFLLESMYSIEESLRKLDSRLYVIQGHPVLSLEKVIDDWNVESVFFEGRIDRGGRMVDQSITSLCQGKGVSVTVCHSHTLYDPDQLSPFAHDGPITNFNLFEEVIQKMGLPKPPLNSPTRLHDNLDKSSQYAIPSSEVLGVPPNSMFQGMWVGGEKEGLKRLEVYITKRLKNKGKTTFLDEPTALSPYIRFGCLSTKLIFQRCCQEKDKDFIHSVYSRMASRDFFLHLCSTVGESTAVLGSFPVVHVL